MNFSARDYNPETGRWLERDPSGFAGGDTNLYAYCHNDPVNYFDPTGMDEKNAAGFGLIGAFTGAIAGYIAAPAYEVLNYISRGAAIGGAVGVFIGTRTSTAADLPTEQQGYIVPKCDSSVATCLNDPSPPPPTSNSPTSDGGAKCPSR